MDGMGDIDTAPTASIQYWLQELLSLKGSEIKGKRDE